MFSPDIYGAPLATALNRVAQLHDAKRAKGTDLAPMAALPDDGSFFAADTLLMFGLYLWMGDFVTAARSDAQFARDLGLMVPHKLVTIVHVVRRLDELRELLRDVIGASALAAKE